MDMYANLRNVILFGFGRSGRKSFIRLSRDFNVLAIVDNDPNRSGESIDGIPIIQFAEAQDLLRSNFTIVTTQAFYYEEIKEQLETIGLVEEINFLDIQRFITAYYWQKKLLFLFKTDISITSKCTLKCKDCQLFMPYWKDSCNRSKEDIYQDIDLFFDKIDFLFDMDIVGGEPFLNKDLADILDYIGNHYSDRIGYLGIVTNGTIIPNQKTIRAIKDNEVSISISDYSDKVDYKKTVNELISILLKEKINYIINKNIQWFDLGVISENYFCEQTKLAEHKRLCNTSCHLLMDKKYYYCGISWAAYAAGIIEENDGFVELESINKNDEKSVTKLLDCSKGRIAVSLCLKCRGFGSDNTQLIQTAVQL